MELYVYKNIKRKKCLYLKKNNKILFIVLFLCIIFFSITNIVKTIDKEKKYLMPLGNIVGIRADTDGVLVLGNENDTGYIDGINPGDNIISIEGEKVYNSKDVNNIISNNKENKYVRVLIERDGKELEKEVMVNKINDEYRLGLWIRDKISGIGTMTFYDPQNKTFAALGHAIKDKDTEELIKIKSGNIYKSYGIEIEKGTYGKVGSIKSNFDVGTQIGDFTKNDEFGINGNLNEYDIGVKHKMLEMGGKKSVKYGPATILFQNKDGIIREYDICINKIDRKNKEDGKDMVIEVVDDELINYTGGIIQGMSGAPIIQDDKIIGAVTHVFVDNPKIGYGIFIDKMII